MMEASAVRSVSCPYCGAQPGEQCRTYKSKRPTGDHKDREALARGEHFSGPYPLTAGTGPHIVEIDDLTVDELMACVKENEKQVWIAERMIEEIEKGDASPWGVEDNPRFPYAEQLKWHQARAREFKRLAAESAADLDGR